MKLLCVGGVFNGVGGRPSGYFKKLVSSIINRLHNRYGAVAYDDVQVLNGGTYESLLEYTTYSAYTHILWMADVPNEYPKVLSDLLKSNPGAVLVQSKNNVGGKYSRQELYARMVVSGAEMLVEFDRDRNGWITGSLLSCTGTVIMGDCNEPSEIANEVVMEFARLKELRKPLCNMGEVPMGDHVGAYGVERKHDVHTGVDLYGEVGQEVYAIECGEVVGVGLFTGEGVGSNWWNETSYVMVRGDSGVVCYGEIEPHVDLGQMIVAGQLVGNLLTVLKKDKGRPMTMLHIERYAYGNTVPISSWIRGWGKPKGLLDVTVLLRGMV
jgi:hypothetical protein